MPEPRRSSVRGMIARGESSTPTKGKTALPPAEFIAQPTKPRARIDYALQRRAALKDFHTGGMLTSEYCEADPYLIKAAKFHGEPTGQACPACKRPGLVHLTYTYGDQLGEYSGRIRTQPELMTLARRVGEFTVYVVEVCPTCQWNFLVERYLLGDGQHRFLENPGRQAN